MDKIPHPRDAAFQPRPALTLATTMLLLAAPLAAAGGPGTASAAAPPESSQVVLDWERILMRTVYPTTPIPPGVPILGFTSVAMYDAANASLAQADSSETAAVATAAHDVLVHYFPAQATTLDAQLAATLATVADGSAEDLGVADGAAAAAAMLTSRLGDGYADPTIHYTLPVGIGTWQPTPPATDMLAPWLGSLRPLVVQQPVTVNGPDELTSAEYAADYNEVRRLGSANSSARTPAQTATALFFNSNSATMVSDALVRHLEAEPLSLSDTARLFARIHAAMTDSVITCWRLKRDVGFWRPSQAIAGAASDGNAATEPESNWAPLVPNPPYSDYVSGHACLTSPAVETIRRTLGPATQLELISVNSPTPRTYGTLNQLEWSALHARIWSGLHFHDAMTDGYRIGHRTARLVMEAID